MAIYISQDLWLSKSLDSGYINANNPRIGYHNLVTIGGIGNNTGSVAGHPATNLANPSTAEYWESPPTASINDAQLLQFDLPASTVWNYVGIAGHNLAGGKYKIQVYTYPGDAPPYFEDITDYIFPLDNSAIMHLFPPMLATRVQIVIAPPVGVPARVAVVYIGEVLTLPGRTYVGHTPIPFGRDTDIVTGMSTNGQFLGRIQTREVLRNTLKQDHVNPAYYRAHIDPFVQAARLRPFFCAWRPGEYPLEVGFCWANKNIVPENAHANGWMRFDIDMTALSPWPLEIAP